MELADYFLQNHDKLLYLLAGISLVLELTLMGLSGPLLFFAIACAITGVLYSLGLVTDWEYEVLSVGLLSTVSAVVLWRPLKKFQGASHVSDSSSDMIGQVVPVSDEVSLNGGSIRHSGIDWQARLDDGSAQASLESGLRVKIVAVEGNVMIVKEQAAD
ncbi:Putative activity regulator of membrane protease YbbK [hydrothermal vent metagenome]|uniref:Activity regulator of membrane protease YbbK n=1 Tax=hydrothermal vent metagenome TaxID=652676 RepID=A0A3B0WUB6_9ZZZZ